MKDIIYVIVTSTNTSDCNVFSDVEVYSTSEKAEEDLKKSYEYSLEYVKRELGDDAIIKQELASNYYLVRCYDYEIYAEIKKTAVE